MPERRRRWLPTRREPLPPADDADVLTAPPDAGRGLDVAAAVTSPSGRLQLRVVLRAEPPDRRGASGPLVVAVTGEVDLATAPLLQAALVDAVDRHRTVRCDLSEVAFFSAAGVNALLVAHERAARAGSRLEIRGAHGITRRVLQISGIDDVLNGQ